MHAKAAEVLEAESTKHILVPQILDGFAGEEANKPQETDDCKRTTKVVATLGPSSWSDAMIPKMIDAGTGIFRGGDFERVYRSSAGTPRCWSVTSRSSATCKAPGSG